jgi:hypothetical protein
VTDPAFHLGRALDGSPVDYPSEHLRTHAVILGMTGSGKTGLGIVMLEEAALAGVPILAIDPKGDLANMLLAFPAQRAEDFAPYVPEGDDPEAVAAAWRKGLAGSEERLAHFAATERVVHTPGSRLARSLSLMPSLAAPASRGDEEEGTRDRAIACASALLALAGIDADPVRAPEHALVANVLLASWSRGRGLDPATLLREIQAPPFAQLGAMDVDAVVPPRERQSLAVKLNAALASPAMAGLLDGEPLDVARLLHDEQGRARVSILSIAHLGESERMFFVTALLGEVLAWMRAQEGTDALRAILYMDEIAGYFPPVAQPPSKAPMLTLLKQARAFGLGVVLATQNPVDLDYKGLSNTGTWLLGRLQTERDKDRVLDGLETLEAGGGADREAIDRQLSALSPRVFLMHDVHARRAPFAFETRWAMSYLRGPMSREQLRRASAGAPPGAPETSVAAAAPPTTAARIEPSAAATSRPVLPGDVAESFLVRADIVPRLYRAGLACRAAVHYAEAKAGVDAWLDPHLIVPLADDGPRWSEAWVLAAPLPESPQPLAGVPFAPLPGPAARAKSYDAWTKQLIAHIARDRPLSLFHAPDRRATSRPGEPRDAFVARLGTELSAARRDALSALDARWSPKIDKAREKLAQAERRREDAGASTGLDVLETGADVLGALVTGRRIGRAATTGARRTIRGGERRARAAEAVESARRALDQLERDQASARAEVEQRTDPARMRIEERRITAKKSEIRVERIALVWVPSPA